MLLLMLLRAIAKYITVRYHAANVFLLHTHRNYRDQLPYYYYYIDSTERRNDFHIYLLETFPDEHRQQRLPSTHYLSSRFALSTPVECQYSKLNA